MKKSVVLSLAVCMTLVCAAACGERTPSSGGSSTTSESRVPWETAKANAKKITIYLDESNVYGSYIQGSEEAYVKNAIEKKFYEDTGNAVNIEILYCTHETFSNSFSGVMTTGRWDAAVSYLGQAGLEETVLNQDVAMDISDLVSAYGDHISEAVDQEAFYAVTTLTAEVIGVPSVVKTKTRGLLARKDYMTRVGYTESAEEAAASGGSLKLCKTIDDFNDMLVKMKAQIPECTTPLIGNSYDLEFTVLAGVCGTAGYQYKSVIYNDDGTVKEVVPGWLSEGYGKMLDYAYYWQKNGLWESDNRVVSDEVRITNFSNGKSGVYCADPNIMNLISVARQVKTVDKDVEFAILSPLDAVDESGKAIENSGAFVENSRTTDCLIINKKSQNAELLIKYLDWMYSSVDNYELCRYGVKGEHWIDAGEGFYKYPENLADRYFINPPYSGAFALLHNDEFAYRLYASYSEEELGWIEKVENSRGMKNETDGMLFYNMPQTINSNFRLAENNIYLNCATKAWTGVADPALTYGGENGEYAAYRKQAGDYIEWLTTQYKLYLQSRAL